MKYVFDTSAFVTLFRSYYRGRFPSLWTRFDSMVSDGRIVSTREVKREIEDQDDQLRVWTDTVAHLFPAPTESVAGFVRTIYGVAHFQANVEQRKLLKGGKNADPFVVSTAASLDPRGTVVRGHAWFF